jgi:DNA-binding PadR family transcriptional regulator
LAVSKDLVAASATPLILSILAEGESYGYAIIKRVSELSNGQMQWTDGMLYPVLHRLESQKSIRSQWRTSGTGRKRKYYCLTKRGIKALQGSRTQWMLVHSTLVKSWQEKPCLT